MGAIVVRLVWTFPVASHVFGVVVVVVLVLGMLVVDHLQVEDKEEENEWWEGMLMDQSGPVLIHPHVVCGGMEIAENEK